MLPQRNASSITFQPELTIQPIYTGGDVAIDNTGRILASCLGEEVVITNLDVGESLARIDGVGGRCVRDEGNMLNVVIGWRNCHCTFT